MTPIPNNNEDSRSQRFRDAAMEAEYETGERESTVQRAKAHIAVRLARMALGSLLILAGIAMLVLPGPGWLCIAAGLAILARDVSWAERLLRIVQKRVPGNVDGKIPRGMLAVYGLIALAAMAFSIWWLTR